MKWIKVFGDYIKKITCEKCDHSWNMEKDDGNPYLCHTCGYDSQKKDFNPQDLERFWKNYEMSKQDTVKG